VFTPDEIKSAALELGADICGIAPVDRFTSAPKGFHPNDIYSNCQSVLVLAKKLSSASLFASSCIPYTYINRVITEEVDGLTLSLSQKLEYLAVKKA
jgi:epoxyqueuosine reductase